MKKRSIILLFIAAAMIALSSCGERKRSALPGTETGVSLSKDAIEKNIGTLDTADWTPDAYGHILHDQIEAATEILPQDRQAMTKSLREKYADQMIRCADSIMLHSCASSHDKLHAMVDSLRLLQKDLANNYRATEIQGISDRRKEHDKMMAYSVSSVYGKSVTSTSVYDGSYDRERRATAASYRAKNPPCATVRQKISSPTVESRLRQRRANFNSKLQAAREREARESF